MIYSVIYNTSTNIIDGVVSGLTQAEIDDYGTQGYGVVACTSTHGVVTNQTAWRVSGGSLVAKTELTYSADVYTIIADGSNSATITITGLTDKVMMDVDGVPWAVNPTVNTMVITSSTAKAIRCALEPDDPLHWMDGEVIIQAVDALTPDPVAIPGVLPVPTVTNV